VPAAVSADRAPGALLLLDDDLLVLDSNGVVERWTGRTPRPGRRPPAARPCSRPGARVFLETHGRPLLLAGESLGEIALDLRDAAGASHPVLLFAHMDDTGRPADRRVHVLLVSAGQRAAYERELRRMRDGARTARRQSELLRHVTQAAAGARTAQDVAASTLELVRRGARADRAVFVALDAGVPEVLHAEPARSTPRPAW
jgi:hypothetical protein